MDYWFFYKNYVCLKLIKKKWRKIGKKEHQRIQVRKIELNNRTMELKVYTILEWIRVKLPFYADCCTGFAPNSLYQVTAITPTLSMWVSNCCHFLPWLYLPIFATADWANGGHPTWSRPIRALLPNFFNECILKEINTGALRNCFSPRGESLSVERSRERELAITKTMDQIGAEDSLSPSSFHSMIVQS